MLVERFAQGPRLQLRAPGLMDLVQVWPVGEGPSDAAAAFAVLWPALLERHGDLNVVGIGHRIVHGGANHAGPCELSKKVLDGLQQLAPLAPLHQPVNLAVAEAAQRVLPKARHVACFDTAFHRGRAFETEAFALPMAYYDQGVRRYGFHGLSYASVVKRLNTDHPELADKKLVVAHLGSGCSLCAMEGGKSVATSMGFSALDGLPMGTRSGQIDPGVLLYLMMDRAMSPAQIEDLLYRRSGLLGLSGLSADVRDLEASDWPQARRALDYFCSRIAVGIAAMAAELGGLDAVVFTAGIGEHSAHVRAKVCQGMAWLGALLDEDQNLASPIGKISQPGSRQDLLIMPTDEEAQIASELAGLI